MSDTWIVRVQLIRGGRVDVNNATVALAYEAMFSDDAAGRAAFDECLEALVRAVDAAAQKRGRP